MQDNQTPPMGNHQQAEKYLTELISALKIGSYPLTHSDLSKFDPGSFQDHYRIDMGEYHAEISHSKHPQSGADSFSLIFTSLDKIRSGQSSQAILSFIPLTADQFTRFKTAANNYFVEQKRREEQKRFQQAMKPIDQLLKISTLEAPSFDNIKLKSTEDSHTSPTAPEHNSQFFNDFAINHKSTPTYTPPRSDSSDK
jgi:hypothetical protein